jgi:hypothetical protein
MIIFLKSMKRIQWVAKSFVDACVIMSPIYISDTPKQNVVMLGNGLINTGVVLITVFRLLSLVVGERKLLYENDG